MGGGVIFPHHCGIVINGGAKIGKNFTCFHNVTIGNVRGGTATIGDNVSIYPNSAIIGNITIGNNVTVGAGSIVVKDIPDNAVVVGNPARVTSFRGLAAR